MHGAPPKRFGTAHKQRLYMFAHCRAKFEPGGRLHRFLSGRVNAHVLGASAESLTYKEFLGLDRLDWSDRMRDPKWQIFVGTSVLNHMLRTESQKYRKRTRGRRASPEQLLAQVKSRLRSFSEFGAVTSECFSSRRHSRPDQLTALRNEAWLGTTWTRLTSALESTQGCELVGVGAARKACLYLYCLVRGVKNSGSLEYLRKYLISELATKAKAEAVRELISCMICQTLDE